MVEREPSQLSLFDADREESDPWKDLRALSHRLPHKVRFGTSSWTFPGWSGLVYQQSYPSQKAFVRESLREYATHPLMRTVGIDRSYYQPMAVADFKHYAEQLPDGFPCVMKVWQQVTTPRFARHPRFGDLSGQANPNFLNPTFFYEQVLTPLADAFIDHTGPLVIEIPPTHGKYSPIEFCERLSLFFDGVPSSYRYAVEIRDPVLFTSEYVSVLMQHGATHVFNYWSWMPDLEAQLKMPDALMGPEVVVRLLLPPGTDYEEQRESYQPFDRIVAPDEKMREDVVDLIHEALGKDFDVFVLVNNKAEGSAPLTIEALARMVAE